MGQRNERIWFKLSCAHFFTVKQTCQKCLAHCPSDCKPPLTAWWKNSSAVSKTHHLYHKRYPAEPRIRFQLAIMQSANNSQHNQNAHRNNVCTFSPQSPAIQLPPLHCERQFPVRLQLMRFQSRSGPSNWISALLLKVQLSMAKLGGSRVWILVSWCKRGRALATYASHQRRTVRRVFVKSLQRKPSGGFSRTCVNKCEHATTLNTLCEMFQQFYARVCESNRGGK